MFEYLKQTYITIFAIICVIIIIVLRTYSFIEIQVLYVAEKWVIHSHEVIENVYRLQSELEEAINHQRGYIITGNQDYIATLNTNKQEIFRLGDLLTQRTSDNPPQQQRAINLANLVKKRLELLDATLNIVKTSGIQAGIKNILAGKGKKVSEDISQNADEFIKQEKQLLSARTDLTYQKAFWLNAIILVSDALVLALILFCIYLLNRQLSFRISAEKKVSDSEEKLYHLAYYDPMTELPNRLSITQQIDFILSDPSKEKMVVVMMLDIDNFKQINETIGHDMGDQLLKLFAARVSKVIRHDDLLSNLGGDNFLIALSDVGDVKDIDQISKKIQEAFLEPFVIQKQTIYLTVSIGISIYPSNGLNAKTLIKNADIAMYHAKELGRNNYQFYTAEMSTEAERRALLQSRLHQALKHENFILLYQPKFSLKENKLVGFEVLMRWVSPEEGLISPDNFIGIAESNGLIVPIGEWMLRKVCRQIKKWQQEGVPVKNMAINVSTRQFTISDFIEIVREVLHETKIDPGILEFEITERVLMEHSSNNISALRVLKDMGIKITLDDFGTGYSSLSYLSRFDIDKLKIDKSFIQAITSPDSDTSIIRAIIVMAHSLDIKVVAEGVETALQAEVLKRYGCDETQGFLYSEPLSESDAKNLLNT